MVQEVVQCCGIRLSLGTMGGGQSCCCCLPQMARIVGIYNIISHIAGLVNCESIHLLYKVRV